MIVGFAAIADLTWPYRLIGFQTNSTPPNSQPIASIANRAVGNHRLVRGEAGKPLQGFDTFARTLVPRPWLNMPMIGYDARG
jgi:hypothetical protein